MSRFFMGLLLGVLVGIGGASAFLIVYGGGDYLVSTSPRMRELEATLRSSDEDRAWLKSRLRESTEATHRLESRFEALAARFEGLAAGAQGSPPAAATSGAEAGDRTGAPAPAAAMEAPATADPGETPEDAAGRPPSPPAPE